MINPTRTTLVGLDDVSSNSGKVAIAQGGTNATTAAAAFNALSPMTTLGDTLYGGTAGAGTRLAGNITATKQFFTQTGAGASSNAPAWAALTTADIGTGTPAASKYVDGGTGAWTTLPSATPGGSTGQIQYNNANAFGGLASTAVATSGALVTISATAATDVPLTLKANATPTGNVLEAKTSAGVTTAAISGTGVFIAPNGSTAAAGYRFAGDGVDTGFFRVGLASWAWMYSGTPYVNFEANDYEALKVSNFFTFAFSSTSDALAAPDCGLYRDSVGTVRVTNGGYLGSGNGSLIVGSSSTARSPLTLVGIVSQAQPLVKLQQQSSTPTARNAGYLDAVLATATDASWKGRIFASAGDFSSSHLAQREGWRVESDGTQALLGFYGATAVAKQVVTGSKATGAALISLLAALVALGLITDSSTA